MNRHVQDKQSAKFVALESCRGICALLVALYHLSANSHLYNLTLVRNGGLGVTYFFVLSGFVMMHAYGAKIRGGADFVPFVVRRFGRLYPLHITILAVLFGVELLKVLLVHDGASSGSPPFSGPNSLPALAGGAVLINGLGFFNVFTWNGPSWTISTEFWTYLVFFAVLMAGRRAPFVALVLAVISGSALATNEAWGDPLRLIAGQGAILCIYCFFIGLVTYHFVRPPLHRRGLDPIWEWLALLLTAAAFMGVIPWKSVADPLIFALVIVVLSFEAGIISRILSNRWLVYLGTISYSIYMVHFTIGTLINSAARVLQSKLHISLMRAGVGDSGFLLDTGHAWQMDALSVAYLLAVVGVASVTYAMIEVPFRERFNRIAIRLKHSGQRRVSANVS
jgi:peptidoglycan/LPS O-acetylase OafA/YrhL